MCIPRAGGRGDDLRMTRADPSDNFRKVAAHVLGDTVIGVHVVGSGEPTCQRVRLIAVAVLSWHFDDSIESLRKLSVVSVGSAAIVVTAGLLGTGSASRLAKRLLASGD